MWSWRNWNRTRVLGNILQPTLCSTLGAYDICPLIARHLLPSLFSLFWVFGSPHAQLRSFYPLSTLDAAHMWEKIPDSLRKHNLLQFRILEWRSLRTRTRLTWYIAGLVFCRWLYWAIGRLLTVIELNSRRDCMLYRPSKRPWCAISHKECVVNMLRNVRYVLLTTAIA